MSPAASERPGVFSSLHVAYFSLYDRFFFYLEKLYKQKGQSVHFLSMQHHSALQGMREHRRLVFSISLRG